MIKTLQTTLKQDKERFKVPRSVQDIIPIRRIWPDGVFQFGSKYSKTLRFSDINYAIASKKETHIGAQTETQVTVAANPQRQGQRVFVEERGRRAARWQAEQRRAISRRQIKTAQVLHSDRDGRSIPDRMRSEQIPRIKKRAETSLPKPARKKHLPMERDIVSVSPHSRKMADTAKTLESAQKQAVMLKSSARAAREATMQTARYQQAAKAAQVTAQKASQAAGRALRAILSAARSLAAAMMAGGSTVLSMVPAVYAVRTTTDTSSPDEVATLREEKLDILRQIFWDMNEVSYWLETISGGEDEDDTVILHIRVEVKDHLQMAEESQFTAEQKKLLEELMQPEYEELVTGKSGFTSIARPIFYHE